MEPSFFATMFEHDRHEQSLFLLSLTDLDISKQSKVTDHEIKITKNLALENFYRQEMLKKYSTLHLLE